MKRSIWALSLGTAVFLLAVFPSAAFEDSGHAAVQEVLYGDGVVYRRQIAAIGSFAGGCQDGPGPQMELTAGGARCIAPNGDCYFLEFERNNVLVKYDAKKKRSYTIAWGGPFGKQGGPAECARFAGGGYMSDMGISLEPGGRFLRIYDINNKGFMWKLDLEKMTVEPDSGADAIKGSAVRGFAPDGSAYFAGNDAKLKKVSPDGKTVQDLGVTLETPLVMSTFAGSLRVDETRGRLVAASRDPHSPWGIIWYWDMKTGKATGVAGPRKGQDIKDLILGSGPCDKVRFWCCSTNVSFGLDRGERYVYLGGGDESTISRIDLEKKYVTKLVHADAKDRSLWTFGEGQQGKDYKFADPYQWPGSPSWGNDGRFYMSWALCSAIDIYTPVAKAEVKK